MTFVCSATWTAQPGQEAVVLAALTGLAPASRAEPGCQTYVVHQDAEQPSVFRIFEVYDDEEAFKAHGRYPHVETYALGRAIPVLVNRERASTNVVEI